MALDRGMEDRACVRDQHVDVARGVDRGRHAGVVRDVEGETFGDGQVVQGARIARGRHHPVPAACELGGDGTPDSSGRSGDEY